MPNAEISTSDFKGEHLSLKMFGAKGDVQVTQVSTTNGSHTIGLVSGPDFSPSDVEKRIIIYGADANTGREVQLGSSPVGITLTDSYTVVNSFDTLGVASKIVVTGNCTFFNATWEIYGANIADYSDEVLLSGPTNIVALAAAINFTATPPTKRYYRIKAKNTIPGDNSLAYFVIVSWGYVLGTTISAFISPSSISITTTAKQTISSTVAYYGTNDSGAIQSAINFANSLVTSGTADGGCAIFVPPGRYLINAPIFHKRNVIFRGDSAGGSIFYVDAEAFPVSTIVWNMTGTFASDTQIAFFTRLEDVRIDCCHTPGSIGIFCDALQENSGLYRVTVINWLHYGIQICSATDQFGCANMVIQDPNIYPSPAAILDSTVRGVIANFAIYVTIIRGTFFGQSPLVGGYGKAIDFSNGFLICLGQIHIESAEIGIHFNTGSGGHVSAIDTQSFVSTALQIDAGNIVSFGTIQSNGKNSLIDNVQNNTLTQSQITRYVSNPIQFPEIIASALLFMQSYPSGGPNLICIDPVNFGTDKQGGFIAVNSRNNGFPNWLQTSANVTYTTAMFMRLGAAIFEILIGPATNNNGTDPAPSFFKVDNDLGGIYTPRIWFDAPATAQGPLNFGNTLGVNRARWFHGGAGQGNLKLQRSTDSGGTWQDAIIIDLITGIVTNAAGYQISNGYGTSPSSPNDLFIGAGGGSVDAISFAFGDGSGYKLNLIANVSGSPTIFATFKDTGEFVTGWIGAGVASPSNASSTFDATDGRIGLLGVGGSADHTGSYFLQVWGPILCTVLTPSTPVLTDSAKSLVSGQIDIGSSVHIKGSGLSAGQICEWNGSKVAGITGVGTANLTEITSGPTSDTFLQSATLGGVVPVGLTLVTTSGTAITGFGIASHTVLNGIVTT